MIDHILQSREPSIVEEPARAFVQPPGERSRAVLAVWRALSRYDTACQCLAFTVAFDLQVGL